MLPPLASNLQVAALLQHPSGMQRHTTYLVHHLVVADEARVRGPKARCRGAEATHEGKVKAWGRKDGGRLVENIVYFKGSSSCFQALG